MDQAFKLLQFIDRDVGPYFHKGVPNFMVTTGTRDPQNMIFPGGCMTNLSARNIVLQYGVDSSALTKNYRTYTCIYHEC